METFAEHIKLFATLERAPQGGTLAGFDLTERQVRPTLSLDPEEQDRRSAELGRTASVLPEGQLDPKTEAIYARKRNQGQDDLLRNLADGIRLCGALLSNATTPPDQLMELMDKEGIYEGFRLLGDRMKNRGMDMRLILGAFMWFLVDRLLGYLETRFTDPALTTSEKEELLDDFGPGLLLVDQMMRQPSERRAEIGAARDRLSAEVKAAAARAAMEEAIYEVHQEVPVARQRLLDAARTHMAQKGRKAPQGKPGQPAPPADPPAPVYDPDPPSKKPRIMR